MDPTNRYLESCQNPSTLQPTELDEVTDEVFFETEMIANSSGFDQTTMDFPKSSTPTKKNGAKQDPQENDTVGSAADDEPGAVGGTLDKRGYPKDATPAAAAAAPPLHPTPPSPEQIYPVPEPIAQISTVDVNDISLHNPDVRPGSTTGILGADQLFDSNSLHSSIMKANEGLENLKKGHSKQSVRCNMRHSGSFESIRSLSNSVSSQQEEIDDMQLKLHSLSIDVSESKAMWESPEIRKEYRSNKYTLTSTHYVPHDCLKQQGKTSFILPTADLNLQAELFLDGFGSGEGTHLSLRLKADIDEQDAAVQLSPQCRFEARIINFDDKEETRKKSNNSEAVEGSHTVEFPKLIEKDVVKNEALGYKKNGVVNITFIVSWAWEEDVISV